MCQGQMNWCMSTDFQKVFDLILNMARKHELSQEQMPNRLYVFSDMQFNQADSGNYLTNFETINVKYRRYGYQIPELVFWNLCGNTVDYPVGDAKTKGVAMISGFDISALKALLNGKELSPIAVLLDTLDSERYDAVKYYE